MRAYSDIMISNEEIDKFRNKGSLDEPECEQYPFNP
jgi:hypothetical protein